MENDCPLSIIIPTCNRPDFVLSAIESALRQLPQDAEIIVVDDGSKVQASASIKRMFPREPRLQVILSAGEVGAAAARNLGVEHSRGRINFFLDDDDVLIPGYIAEVIKNINSNAGLTWGFSPVLKHGGSGASELAPLSQVTGKILKAPAGRQHLSGLGCGFWIERELFKKINGIDSSFKINEDTEFCVRLLALGHMPWVSNEPGVSVYRANEGNGMNQASLTKSIGAIERAEVFAEIINRHRGFLREAPVIHAFLRRRLLKMLAKSGQFNNGLKAASRTGRLNDFVFFLLNWTAYRVRP